MDSTSAASRAAAQRHARAVAAGPPRSARWTRPSAAATAVSAALAWPLLRPAAVALASVTVLLLAVAREDRRQAWRYLPEPAAPAVVLPPRRRPQQPSPGRTVPPARTPMPVPTRTGLGHGPGLRLPQPRRPVLAARPSALRARVARSGRRSRTATR